MIRLGKVKLINLRVWEYVREYARNKVWDMTDNIIGSTRRIVWHSIKGKVK
jgi:hypothetical protein